MKILFVTDTYPPNVNGAALATHRLAVALSRDNQDMYVLAPSTAFRNYKRQEEGITVYRFRSILVQRSQRLRVSPQPLHFREIKKIIDEIKPDVIHVNNPGFIAQSAIRIGKKRNIPVIGTSHIMPENLVHYFRLPDSLEKVVANVIGKQYGYIYSKLDLIIAPTQTAANLLHKLQLKNKIVVISNGIDLTRFNPQNDGEYLRQRFEIPAKPNILFLGRLDPEKSLDVLLRAVALLKKRLDLHLTIVGKGREMKNLKQLAELLGITEDVTFAGYLPDKDLPNIYGVADIFVMPSIAELQSLVCMEAMACGLPVVGADAVALPHLIKNGINGYLFKPGDAADLAEKLSNILSDKTLQKKMGEESLKIIKPHDMRIVVRQVEEVYDEGIGMSKDRKPVDMTFKKTVFSNLGRVKDYMSDFRGIFTE